MSGKFCLSTIFGSYLSENLLIDPEPQTECIADQHKLTFYLQGDALINP
jgi:hypothetical protein